jgi:hypothetical protein
MLILEVHNAITRGIALSLSLSLSLSLNRMGDRKRKDYQHVAADITDKTLLFDDNLVMLRLAVAADVKNTGVGRGGLPDSRAGNVFPMILSKIFQDSDFMSSVWTVLCRPFSAAAEVKVLIFCQAPIHTTIFFIWNSGIGNASWKRRAAASPPCDSHLRACTRRPC